MFSYYKLQSFYLYANVSETADSVLRPVTKNQVRIYWLLVPPLFELDLKLKPELIYVNNSFGTRTNLKLSDIWKLYSQSQVRSFLKKNCR